METMGLHNVIYFFILNWPLRMCTNAAFTEVPNDVSVGEGEDVEMPCAFKAASSAPTSLEIQWWYLREERPAQQLDAKTVKIGLGEATKISAVRVHGNAISHRLSLSKVKMEDSGVYECRVSDVWFEQPQEIMVHAALHVIPGHAMLAEEAVSHIQYKSSLRKTNTSLGGPVSGRATSVPGLGLAIGQRPLQDKPGLLPSFISTTIISLAKSSATTLPQNDGIFCHRHRADCSIMTTMDQLLCFTFSVVQKLFPLLLLH